MNDNFIDSEWSKFCLSKKNNVYEEEDNAEDFEVETKKKELLTDYKQSIILNKYKNPTI